MSDFIKRFAFFHKLNELYRDYAAMLFYGLLFCLPIKLTLTYLFLFPLLLLALANFTIENRWKSFLNQHIALTVWGVFLLTLLFSAPFGIEPLRSLARTSSFLIYSLSIPIFIDLIPKVSLSKALGALFCSQAITATYSIFEFFNPHAKQIFVGTISESGQIALVMPLLLGAVLMQRQQKTEDRRSMIFLYSCGLLIFTALLLNLKRGPLSGVIVSMFLLATLVRCRACILVLLISILPVFFFGPLQERILQSSSHFFIKGGRSEIWKIGLKLMQEYPLGIGFSNSSFLQKFSVTIPAELKHFHNNFINVMVETGILGTCLYFSFILIILHLAWQKRTNVMIAAAGAGLLSNQIAGLVEYNLGDSEVLFIMYFAVSLIICLPAPKYSKEALA